MGTDGKLSVAWRRLWWKLNIIGFKHIVKETQKEPECPLPKNGQNQGNKGNNTKIEGKKK